MFKASLAVTVLTAAGSGLGFLNQVVFALFFGASREVDLFLMATSVPVVVAGMVSSIISYSVVPRIVGFSSQLELQGNYIYTVLLTMLGVASVLGVVGFFASPWQMGAFGAFDAKIILINQITWIVCSVQIITAYFSAVSVAFKYFVRSAAAGLFPYLGMLFATLFAGEYFGIVAVSAGLLGGTLIAGLFLAWNIKSHVPCCRDARFSWQEAWSVLLQSPLSAIAMSCFSIYAVIDAYFALQLEATALSYLGYSQRLLIGIGGLLIAGPSSVLVPHFSLAASQGRMEDFRRDALRVVGALVVVALLVALVASHYAELLTRVLLMRGAFDARAVVGVAEVLSVMLFGMVPMLAVVFFFRLFYCLGVIMPQVLVGLLWGLLYFTGTGMTIVEYGIRALPYAYVASWMGCFLLCAFVLERLTRLKQA